MDQPAVKIDHWCCERQFFIELIAHTKGLPVAMVTKCPALVARTSTSRVRGKVGIQYLRLCHLNQWR